MYSSSSALTQAYSSFVLSSSSSRCLGARAPLALNAPPLRRGERVEGQLEEHPREEEENEKRQDSLLLHISMVSKDESSRDEMILRREEEGEGGGELDVPSVSIV